MNNKGIFTPRFFVLSSLILIAAATRFLPHPPNFTAVGALAMFGAANFEDKRLAFILPILVMLLTDLFIPFGFSPEVYVSFIGVVLIGFMLRDRINARNVIIGSLASSVLFYLVTNLVFWYTFYPHNLAGQMESYTAALPFFANSLAGDLFFNGVFFGAFALMRKTYPVLAK